MDIVLMFPGPTTPQVKVFITCSVKYAQFRDDLTTTATTTITATTATITAP